MSELVGQRIIAVVGQEPFEAGEDQLNLFCTVKPVLMEDGTLADPESFPNNGLIWWMVRSNLRPITVPGRLITGRLEFARKYEMADPASNYFQLNVASAEPVHQDDAFEILSLKDNAIGHARDLLNLPDLVTVDHPPANYVLVRWRGHLYGPLKTEWALKPGERHRFTVSFSNLAPDRTVLEIPDTALTDLGDNASRILEVEVSGDAQVLDRTHNRIVCRYEIILNDDYKRLSTEAVRLSLASHSDVLRGTAKRILGRKKRQELTQLLDEMNQVLTTSGPEILRDEAESLKAVQERLKIDLETSKQLAEGILGSGMLEERIQEGIEARAQRYVEERAAELQGTVANRIQAKREELEALEKQRLTLETELTARRQVFERELQRLREESDAELERERRSFQSQQEKLANQRNAIQTHLEAVTVRFSEEREQVVNQFLELLPLLQRTNVLGSTVAQGAPESAKTKTVTNTERTFQLPDFVVGGTEATETVEITEKEFFERFEAHARATGFSFRRIDLVSFHLSVKTGDLTILGGVSGTGKSTLPMIYTEALAGGGSSQGDRYHFLGVSPSWLDGRDLLGQVNALDGTFLPSENGLYQKMIFAEEEAKARGADSGVYIVCLDEMNLSHVEHYFAGFLQALERPEGYRRVSVFSPDSVRPDSAFQRWPSLNLPRSVRFVGTVNFDETTKQLSLRVLDRANLIQLRPGSLPDMNLGAEGEEKPFVTGPPVTTRMLLSWRHLEGLPKEQGSVIDALREPLGTLGCPLSPRRYRAICQFVASANQLCSPEEALDLQISQRVLPQVRGLFRPDSKSALGRLRETLEAQPVPYAESLRFLDQLEQGETTDLLFGDG